MNGQPKKTHQGGRAKKSRVLWVHAGGHKTGSKAIQNYLYLGGLQTTAPDFFYRKPPGEEDPKYLNSGNGVTFFPLPTGRNLTAKLEDFVGTDAEAILSNENFALLTDEEWEKLDTAASDIGIEVRVIFFVRDALPYCLSAYDQGIKEGWITTQFADYGLTAEWLHPKALRNLVGVFPPSRLRVLHYESERQNLLRAFFRAVGVSSPLISPLGSEIGFLNRSLTRETRDLLLQINQDQNNRIFSEVLNHGLQAAYPDASAERLPIPTDLMEKLSDRFAGDVDWINKTFFQGARIVGLGAETSRVGQGKFSEKQLKRSLQVHKTGLEIILKKSTGMLEKFHNRIIYRVLTLDRENLVSPEIPNDFDPVAYLILNKDLIIVDIPVVRHFLDHGRREGRMYSWSHLGKKPQ
jgi:hypothetical protein